MIGVGLARVLWPRFRGIFPGGFALGVYFAALLLLRLGRVAAPIPALGDIEGGELSHELVQESSVLEVLLEGGDLMEGDPLRRALHRITLRAMKSPFPGFDPYLEESWGDVHQRLAIYASNAIQPQLPADLRARTEERVYVEYEDSKRRAMVPDLGVLERSRVGGGTVGNSPANRSTAVLEPLAVLVSDPVTESYVEIREKGGGKLISVIEFVSPSNKVPGPGREKYRQKQRELEAADVHVVEIDLVRAGERVFDFPGPIAEECAPMLMAHLRKGYEHRLYAFSLRERLPVLPIPLRYEEPEIVLDLQPLHDQCYRDGAYDDIAYSKDPVLPLDSENAVWVDSLLRKAGCRG